MTLFCKTAPYWGVALPFGILTPYLLFVNEPAIVAGFVTFVMWAILAPAAFIEVW